MLKSFVLIHVLSLSALLAGGFGRDGQAQRPLEIAATVPAGTETQNVTGFFERRYAASGDASPQGTASLSEKKELDIEEIGATQPVVSSGKRTESWNTDSLEGPVVSSLCTHFHLDLASAVHAAVGDNW